MCYRHDGSHPQPHTNLLLSTSLPFSYPASITDVQNEKKIPDSLNFWPQLGAESWAPSSCFYVKSIAGMF